MMDLNGATKILTDKEILSRFAEVFNKHIRPESRLEVIEQMSKDFMNALSIVGFIVGQDEDYVKGYLKASFNKREVSK